MISISQRISKIKERSRNNLKRFAEFEKSYNQELETGFIYTALLGPIGFAVHPLLGASLFAYGSYKTFKGYDDWSKKYTDDLSK